VRGRRDRVDVGGCVGGGVVEGKDSDSNSIVNRVKVYM